MFQTARHWFFLCAYSITWFKLSRVKLYRNDLKRKQNYFKLVGGLSYGGFKLPRAKSSKNQFWFKLTQGLS